MGQIAIEANYFNLLPSGGWMPNFTGTFFIDSSGTVSLNHEVLTLNSVPLSSWNRMGKSSAGVKGVNFWVAGENFMILDDEALTMAVPFFENNLSAKFEE